MAIPILMGVRKYNSIKCSKDRVDDIGRFSDNINYYNNFTSSMLQIQFVHLIPS